MQGIKVSPQVWSAIIVIYCGLAFLLARVAAVDLVLRWHMDWPAMVPSTTISFLLLALALPLAKTKVLSEQIMFSLTTIWAGTIALANLIVAVLHPYTSIDWFLGFVEHIEDHMSPMTSIMILFAVAVLACLVFHRADFDRWAQVICRIGLTLVAIVFVAQVVRLTSGWGLGFYKGVSMPTLLMAGTVFLGLASVANEASFEPTV